MLDKPALVATFLMASQNSRSTNFPLAKNWRPSLPAWHLPVMIPVAGTSPTFFRFASGLPTSKTGFLSSACLARKKNGIGEEAFLTRLKVSSTNFLSRTLAKVLSIGLVLFLPLKRRFLVFAAYYILRVPFLS